MQMNGIVVLEFEPILGQTIYESLAPSRIIFFKQLQLGALPSCLQPSELCKAQEVIFGRGFRFRTSHCQRFQVC